MAYTDIISLDNAKTYLGVDDTSRDTEITRMIKVSLSYLEKATNIYVQDHDKEYVLDNGCVRVYDWPINTLDANLTGVTRTKKYLYSIYEDSNNKTLTLNIGYTAADVDKIPPEWIECGYAIIECLFEGGKLAELPELIKMVIGQLKRFVI